MLVPEKKSAALAVDTPKHLIYAVMWTPFLIDTQGCKANALFVISALSFTLVQAYITILWPVCKPCNGDASLGAYHTLQVHLLAIKVYRELFHV